MVYMFLADGFEEVEALTPLDMLRRARIPVSTVGIGSAYPRGAHDIVVKADIAPEEIRIDELTAVILPGGMPGTTNLERSADVQRVITYAMEKHVPIAAICAAPSILGHAGFLEGRQATCYPGFETDLQGALLTDEPVIWDGNILTAKGAGVALEFAFALVSRLASDEISDEIRGAIQCR